MNDPAFTLKEIAAILGLSYPQVLRMFRGAKLLKWRQGMPRPLKFKLSRIADRLPHIAALIQLAQ
jgi:hypothetical protein